MACKICSGHLSINPSIEDTGMNNATDRESLEPGHQSHLSVTKCGHILHHICLTGWLTVCSQAMRKTECPTCRSGLEANQYTMLYPHNGLMNSQGGLFEFGHLNLVAGFTGHSTLLVTLKEEVSSLMSKAAELESEEQDIGWDVCRLNNSSDVLGSSQSQLPPVGRGRGNRLAAKTNIGQTELQRKLLTWADTRKELRDTQTRSIRLWRLVRFVENAIVKANEFSTRVASQEVPPASNVAVPQPEVPGSAQNDDEDLSADLFLQSMHGTAARLPVRGAWSSIGGGSRADLYARVARWSRISPRFGPPPAASDPTPGPSNDRGTIRRSRFSNGLATSGFGPPPATSDSIWRTTSSARRPLATLTSGRGASTGALALRSQGTAAGTRLGRISVGRGMSASSVNVSSVQRRAPVNDLGPSRSRNLAASMGSLVEPRARNLIGLTAAIPPPQESRRVAAVIPARGSGHRLVTSTRNTTGLTNSSTRQDQSSGRILRRDTATTRVPAPPRPAPAAPPPASAPPPPAWTRDPRWAGWIENSLWHTDLRRLVDNVHNDRYLLQPNSIVILLLRFKNMTTDARLRQRAMLIHFGNMREAGRFARGEITEPIYQTFDFPPDTR